MSSCINHLPIAFEHVSRWSNLLLAWRKAAKGKRSKNTCAGFEYMLADQLLTLQQELQSGRYRPGRYTHFYIHEPKRRKISAAPFRDRVVHHALCNVIEPVFEQLFIADSYANRKNKGTHKAIDRLQSFCQQNTYVLQLDIVKHFPSLDHTILYETLSKQISDPKILQLIQIIINSGKNIFEQDVNLQSDNLESSFRCARFRGLPIGNLTSQFWSNCYLHPLDLFIKRELGCRHYLRYVDDFALFSDSKKQLWQWKQEIRNKLTTLRLGFHEQKAHVKPVSVGVPWLGFIIYPQYRRIKGRKANHTRRHLNKRYLAWQRGEISFAEFDASVQGWINHVRYADTWGLRKSVLDSFRL